ncbi:MAG: hypothetical protein JXA78_06890 [Anaerolineales bacterium]|nr:hypothetical protein [Anaerolineales bacterium]
MDYPPRNPPGTDDQDQIVVEYNLDAVKCADWVIGPGPQGDNAGVVAQGAPLMIAACPPSIAGQMLEKLL